MEELQLRKARAEISSLAAEISSNPHATVEDKSLLIRRLGVRIEWQGRFFNETCHVELSGIERQFENARAFGDWVVNEVIPQIAEKN